MASTKIQSEQIEDGAITAAKIADGAIVASEVADNAITTAKINADAVTGAKIADNAINSEHYTDGSIDTAHIAASQITVAKMAANSVDSDQYVDGSIDTAHIADAQITVGKMAANSVDSDQYVDGSIDTAHIADSQITVGKMAANSVDSAQYVDGSIDTAHYADNSITGAELADNIDIAGTFDVTGATTLDSTLQVDGSITSSAKATITVADNSDTLTLVSTDTDASVGPVLLLLRNPGQAGADDDLLGRIQWKGYDDATNDFTAATIFSKIRDASNGSEDSQLTVQTVVAGTLTNRLEFNEGEAVFNDDSKDLDFRVESDNDANAFFVWGEYGHTGLGTTTPSKKLVVSNGGAQGIELSPAESGVSRIFSYNRSSNAYTPLTIQSEYLTFGTGTSNAERVRINAEGIAFNGDSAAANSLDDYEEGTFEPTAAIAGGSGTVAFTSGGNLLSYTKIGNTVFITGSLVIDSNNGNGGRLNIGNLPFTSANGTDVSTRALMDCRMEAGTGSQASGFFSVINEGGSHIQIQTYTGITSANDSVVTMAAGASLTISGNYQAA